MRVEFRKAALPRELRALIAFDRRVFPAADRFNAAYWQEVESWWMFVGGVKAGCCAFEKRGKTLYLSTTGLLPRFQEQGLGAILKSWEVAYARYHGFRRVSAHCRKRNTRMIALNRQFGFRIVRTIRGYYTDPEDAAVLMELRLRHANHISR
ncbi:MAG TPA: GNAT family N-acetyltransferase [Bryobacteraceae bacterium]|nr:GNAT family N-acetyltransferase [Bryobacteraceae bacterium]